MLTRLRSLLKDVLDSDENSNAFKLHARAVALEAEGQELTLRFSFEAGEAAMKRHLGRPDNLMKLAQDYLDVLRTKTKGYSDIRTVKATGTKRRPM